MITVLEAIKLSTEYLEKKGVESARLNAELLLSHILGCKRLNLYLMFDRPLKESELNLYRDFISRRGKREPLQYIIGSVEFFNIILKIDSRCLIPRPETELLVENVIKFYEQKENLKFLEIGVGSGCITIALLKNLKNSTAISVDLSDDAISLTKENLLLNNIYNNFTLIKFDALKDDYSKLGKFDFVISNPPYISKSDYEKLQPELKYYEPKIALTDMEGGLKFYKKIIENSHLLLNSTGMLFFEIAPELTESVKELMLNHNFNSINIVNDFNNKCRIIYGEKK